MIEWVMLIMLGFFSAGLIALLLAPTLWRRAVRLTTRRIVATMPMSLSDIEADKDMLRASYAIQVRRLETALEKAREKSADQLVEVSKLQMQIGELQSQKADLQRLLEERSNAANVFEKTLRKRFPELEEQLAAARAALDERGVELADLRNKVARKEEAANLAQQASTHQQNEIRQLREALEKSGADQSGRFKKRPAQWTLEEYRSEYDRLNLELSKMREQLALAQDRESHQAVVLKAEMQQLAEQIMTVVSTKPQGPANPGGAEAPRPTVAVREAPRRSKNSASIERPLATPRPWPKEQIIEQNELTLSQDVTSPLNSQKTPVENAQSATLEESAQTEASGGGELANSLTNMKRNNKFTESFASAGRQNSLVQPVSAPQIDGSSSKLFSRASLNAPAVDHSGEQHDPNSDSQASLKSLLDRGAKCSKVDVEAGKPVFAAMFGTKETAAEARVSNTFVPGPDAIPANLTLASLAEVDETPPVVAPEATSASNQEAQMDRMLREIFENRANTASAEKAAITADEAADSDDAAATKADLMQRLRTLQERQTG